MESRYFKKGQQIQLVSSKQEKDRFSFYLYLSHIHTLKDTDK